MIEKNDLVSYHINQLEIYRSGIMDSRCLWREYEDLIDEEIKLSGWIRTNRDQKEIGFINFSDGTSFKNIQIVYDKLLDNFSEVVKYKNGSSISVSGVVVKSPSKEQPFEIKATRIELLGDCPDDYPLQAKRHTREFLRDQAYLRPRTNLFQAVFRIRSLASFAIHKYFNENNFLYVHTPIISASDGEGAGEMFRVTTIDDTKDFSKDFFGKKVGLTVTGQLEGETFALAFNKIYTFGPTFRAEHSNTKTHAAEFWMIEPEMAFIDLDGLMDEEEKLLKYIIEYVLKHAKDEYEFLNKFVDKDLIERLQKIVDANFKRISYEEAIKILVENNNQFEIKSEMGKDLAKEHEVFLTKQFGGPVFVYDWPEEIKAFYMRRNDDQKTVAAVDLLVPLAGELMGGSQREERLDILEEKIKQFNLNEKDYWWYINLRKYGSVVHSGFGLGFERLIIYLTGVDNIRDVLPFPRTVGSCEF